MAASPKSDGGGSHSSSSEDDFLNSSPLVPSRPEQVISNSSLETRKRNFENLHNELARANDRVNESQVFPPKRPQSLWEEGSSSLPVRLPILRPPSYAMATGVIGSSSSQPINSQISFEKQKQRLAQYPEPLVLPNYNQIFSNTSQSEREKLLQAKYQKLKKKFKEERETNKRLMSDFIDLAKSTKSAKSNFSDQVRAPVSEPTKTSATSQEKKPGKWNKDEWHVRLLISV
jgi:hypothetical protein